MGCGVAVVALGSRIESPCHHSHLHTTAISTLASSSHVHTLLASFVVVFADACRTRIGIQTVFERPKLGGRNDVVNYERMFQCFQWFYPLGRLIGLQHERRTRSFANVRRCEEGNAEPANAGACVRHSLSNKL